MDSFSAEKVNNGWVVRSSCKTFVFSTVGEMLAFLGRRLEVHSKIEAIAGVDYPKEEDDDS